MKSQSQDHLKQQPNILSKAKFLYSRAAIWPQLLEIDQQQIHQVENVKLNQKNQRVIKFDVLRTRGFLFDNKMKQSLEQLLTYYVLKNQISYKQGLHEIAALFIIYQKAGLSLSIIYSMFDQFIKRYMTNFFDDDFQGIQCVLQAFYILLKYHDMELHNCFVKCEFPPQLFAIPWFITLFINKANFEIAQMIVENTMLINDKYFIFSFNIAILLTYKQQIIVKGMDNLPTFISKIYLDNEEFYLQVIKIALKIHTHTPKSFWKSLDEINLFSHHAKPLFFTDLFKDLQIIQISPHEAIEMIKQHVLQTEIWTIQQLPQIKKLTQIFQQQIYSPQQPFIIFYDLREEIKQKFNQTLVQIIDLSKQSMMKIVQQLENFKLTNKLWICLMITPETQQYCIYHSNLVEQFLQKISVNNTKYICKCDKEQFLQLYCQNN